MTITLLQLALAATVLTADAAPQGGSPWGNLKVQFVYDGVPPAAARLNVPANVLAGRAAPLREDLVVDSQGGVKNIVVYVRTKDVTVHPRAMRGVQNQVVMEADGLRFEPHVLPMLVTQTLEFRNSEAFAINANLSELGGPGANPLLKPGARFLYTYQRSQSIGQSVTCNVLPWYKAYVLPRDNPYVAVSGSDGSLEISGLPLGELEFQVWHERAGYVHTSELPKGRFNFHVQPGDNDMGVIKLAPQVFN